MPGKMIALVAGTGLAAAAGAALFLGGNALHTEDGAAARRGVFSEAFEVCLKNGLDMIEGARARCYSEKELASLRERPVLDASGAPARVDLSHPTDYSRSVEPVTTCAEYDAKIADGWYAISSREMRREAWFIRACGALEILMEARRPDVTYFSEDGCSESDIESLAAGAPLGMAPEGETGPVQSVQRDGPHGWRLTASGSTAHIQEVAHADFTGDGRGDMLVFVSVDAEGGTASAAMVGLLDKPSADGPVRLILAE